MHSDPTAFTIDQIDEETTPASALGADTHQAFCGGGNADAGEPSLTEFQVAEWTRRTGLVRQLAELKARGISLNAAAKLLGEPVANLCRYAKAYAAGGAEALRPDISTGRTPKFSLSRAEANALRLENLKRGSLALAIEWFPRDPACTPATRALILAELDRAARERKQPAWPASLRRAGYVSEEERAMLRGGKAFQDVEHCDRRGMFYVDEAGHRHMMAPNTLWESDDMSLNTPFRFTCPETGAQKLGRQSLNTIDVFSAHWIAGQPLGRTRDAYRVEDIADHMLGCVEAHGLPLHWRLERGVWENDFVKGTRLGTCQCQGECGCKRWGGLGTLFRVHFTFKSRGKGTVESSFDLLQSLMAHASTDIGRHRGEFERATALYLRAKNGDAEALTHFWDIAAAADGLVDAMIAFCQRPKQRRAHGKAPVVPADLFQAATRRDLPASERWRFCPIKREATVRQGHIECTVDHYPLPFRFRVNGAVDGLYLTHGHRVLVAFHPGRPEEGCHVFNAEGDNERNRDGWRHAERMLTAPMAEDAPQFSVSPAGREFAARKNARAAVVSAFRGITKAGTPIVRRTETRDGWGNRSANFASAPHATQGDPAGGPNGCLHETRGAGTPSSPIPHRSSPIAPRDPDAELAELARLEAEAMERGDLVTT